MPKAVRRRGLPVNVPARVWSLSGPVTAARFVHAQDRDRLLRQVWTSDGQIFSRLLALIEAGL